MRSQRLLCAGLVAAVGLGAAPAASVAAPYVHRGLTLSRSDWALDVGLGIGHVDVPRDDYTGLGLNLELAVGVGSLLELGFRTGVRIGRDGKATRADEYGRMFDTETYGTGGESLATPELRLTWSLAQGSAAELGLQGRVYLPIEDGTHFGLMLALPLVLRLGGAARIDTGVYLPIIFDEDEDGDGDADGARTLVSVPFHLFFQVNPRLFLGPLLGVAFDHGDERFPLGFGLGYGLSYDVDLETWFLFPDISCDGCADTFGLGVGIQARF